MARRSRRALLAWVRRFAPASFAQRLERWRILLDSLELRPALVLVLLAATVAATAVVMLRIWLLFRALDVDVPATLLVASAALISILQTLPVSIAGVGVRDAVLVAALARYGYTPERALALSALFLILVIEQMLVGFLVTMRHPLGSAASRGLASAAASSSGDAP